VENLWSSWPAGGVAPELGGGWPLLIVAALVWSLVWKGLALWKSARKGSKRWFIVLLVVNTVGILEILYIFLFSKTKRIAE